MHKIPPAQMDALHSQDCGSNPTPDAVHIRNAPSLIGSLVGVVLLRA
jgi:hypothetical protein